MVDDVVSADDLLVEYEVDDGQGGKKKMTMKWTDFMKSEELPKEYRMLVLETKSAGLEKMNSIKKEEGK